MPKGSLCPPHAGPGWAGDGGQEDGYGDIPPGTWGGTTLARVLRAPSSRTGTTESPGAGSAALGTC